MREIHLFGVYACFMNINICARTKAVNAVSWPIAVVRPLYTLLPRLVNLPNTGLRGALHGNSLHAIPDSAVCSMPYETPLHLYVLICIRRFLRGGFRLPAEPAPAGCGGVIRSSAFAVLVWVACYGRAAVSL